MHYNFETKAALGPSLGFGVMRAGFLFTSTLSTRQREKSLLQTLRVGEWGVLVFPWQEGS